MAQIFILMWRQEFLVSLSTKTWGNGLGAMVELSHKHFLGGFSPNYLFFSLQRGIVSIYLHVPRGVDAGDFLFYYPTKKKERGLRPNTPEK